VIIEQQKEALMQIIILCKARPAIPEVHLPIAIIVNLHLIWKPCTRFFSKDGLMKI
jgi:hypothetical protein